MRRRYINRIEVWKNESVSDTYGGFTNTAEQLSSSWCNVTTIPVDKMTDYGLNTSQNAINIELRYRNDLDYEQDGIYFVYKGKKFEPTSITPVDIDKEILTITASYVGNAESAVVPLVETFDLTFDPSFR